MLQGFEESFVFDADSCSFCCPGGVAHSAIYCFFNLLSKKLQNNIFKLKLGNVTLHLKEKSCCF